MQIDVLVRYFEAPHSANFAQNIAVTLLLGLILRSTWIAYGKSYVPNTEPQACEITSRQSFPQDHDGLQMWVESLRGTTTIFI
jgi:hypothetical protein